MVSFLANFLTDLLSIPIQAHDIEIAHRIGPPPQSNKRWAVIFKLLHFQKKLDILEAAKSQELKYQDQPVRITTDMSAQRRRLRGEFWPLRQQLHDKGIQTRVWDPATLWVWIVDKIHKFDNVKTATVSMKSIFLDID
ncbi:hypothetical protein ABVT39_027133 [Epinephelus coioides]